MAYWTIGVLFAGWTAYSCTQQPLFPFQLDNLAWTRWWLLTTCADFWILGFGFSTVVWFSEESTLGAIVWILLVNLLGSSMCMLYLWVRVFRFGVAGLRLSRAHEEESQKLLD
jgi:hypothetical protein